MTDFDGSALFDAILREADQFSQSLESDEARDKFHLQAMVSLAKLKTLNRSIHRKIDEERKQLDEKKTTIEKLQLNLENLIYEKNYLLREIHHCQDISTPSLHQIEEERGHLIGILNYQDNLFPELHQQALQEIELERQERIEMEEQYRQLQLVYGAKLDEVERKRKFLEEFPKRIATIQSSALEMEKDLEVMLNPPIAEDLPTAEETPSQGQAVVEPGEEGEIFSESNNDQKEKSSSAMDIE